MSKSASKKPKKTQSSIGRQTATFATNHAARVVAALLGATLILALLAGLPSLWPHTFGALHRLKIDTDPENMLPKDEPVRILHDRMKKQMALHDMIVLGVVNESHEQGVFNPASLRRIHALTEFSRGLRWRDAENPRRRVGIVPRDMIAPSLVDSIEPGGPGVVKFEWLMREPPETLEAAADVRRKAQRIPFLAGTLVSTDGKAICLYLPLTSKDLSHAVYSALQEKIEDASRLFPSEIGNLTPVLEKFAQADKGKGDVFVRLLWQALNPDTRQMILRAAGSTSVWAEALAKANGDKASRQNTENLRNLFRERRRTRETLVRELNAWMRTPAPDEWEDLPEEHGQRLGPEAESLLAAGAKRSPEKNRRLKRLWIETAFEGQLAKGRVVSFTGRDDYHITGLPVAEDTFGVQMFKQMAISGPLAMIIIFAVMWFFFRNTVISAAVLLDAGIATVCTMSLLIVTGNTVHIMSSMIPIFIVPIAVLDDVHVISEFFDRYQETGDRKKTLVNLMGSLFVPMLYTTLTTAVGFASLALAPIPPVQVFGLFVAFGVIVAWVCSVVLVPAYITLLPKRMLENFGARTEEKQSGHGSRTFLARLMLATGKGTSRHAKSIIWLSLAVLVFSLYGISRIRVNDNPTKWFTKDHPIRTAERVLNTHFGGTYMAYLSFRPEQDPYIPAKTQDERQSRQKPANKGSLNREKQAGKKSPDLPSGLGRAADDGEGGRESAEPAVPSGLAGGESGPEGASEPALPSGLNGETNSENQNDGGQTEPKTTAGKPQIELFKKPELLVWLAELQNYMDEKLSGRVGKSNGLADIVKTVHRDLMAEKLGESEAFRIPDTRQAVAQCLLQFQNSHRPQDLWHFVTPDYRTSVLWLQLTSGDNRDMSAVKREVDTYIADHPPPENLRHDWFGLTYINVVWQQKMVVGMLKAFIGSFLAVFLMMVLLYRSALWGALCMAPLTLTIALIYGLIGWVGKPYDMPVAVLSALSLGLAVDYAIHFLTRSRMMYSEDGDWHQTAGRVFGEPARAITRNAIVVGLGFLPLLAAPLVPYRTVGSLVASILVIAGGASLIILPAAISLLESRLFPREQNTCTMCNRGTCIVSIVAAGALVVVNVQQLLQVGWTLMTGLSLPVIVLLAGICLWFSRSEKETNEAFVKQKDSQQTRKQKE